ncbi:ATP-dependent helicase [Neobacillus piezotolerans]|uniref:ATP-dependent helicase n=2 Tax=Neobacillus piezotolerans TaxID=2259171 RepID=A0A3D8GJU6_9BACI|nr:ATP-dependent helicase [Neobacillus piezotolerans]
MPKELYNILTGALLLDNPDYKKAVKYGFSAKNIPETIKLYKLTNETLTVPRGMAKGIIRYLTKKQTRYEMQDLRLLLPEVSFKSEIKLRDYQESAVSRILENTQGFLVSPCGSGKTVMMIEMMARIRQPTLFIVHQKELMDQIIVAAVNLTDLTKEEIGVLGSGKRTVGERMTVATIQTLNKLNLEEYIDKFGAVFIDEAHHLAAKSFYEVISKFKGCYRFAVSATPERGDGLTQMVYACTGGIIHEIEQNQVPTIIPLLKSVKTAFTSQLNEHSQIVKKLISDKARNQLIVDHIKREAAGNYSLVLSDRVEHLNTLKNLLVKQLPGMTIEILTGDLPKAKRKELMEKAKAKQIDILLATQLAREGLDIPHLNRLFLTYPKKSQASVQQEVGRIMRPCEGKKNAIVYDFIDQNGILYSQFTKRRAVYRKIGIKTG